MRLDVPIHHVALAMHEISLYHGRPETYPMCLCKQVKACLKQGEYHPLASELVDVLLDLKVVFKKDFACMDKLRRRNIENICKEHAIPKEVLQRALKGDIITLDEKNLIEGLR